MKNSRNLLARIFPIAIVAAVSLTAVYSFAQDQKVPTKKEVATLLKTAKQPADHLRIAAYYKQEAARQRQVAKEHADLAVIYQKTHPFAAMEAKNGYAAQESASHCNKFAELAIEQAKQDDALVTLHEEMANQAAPKQ